MVNKHTERFKIKEKIRAITVPAGITDNELAKKMKMAKQSFAYRMQVGFSESEVVHLADMLGVEREDLVTQ